MKFCDIYPLYIAKVERKNRTKEEVDKVICWLTGYKVEQFMLNADNHTDLETFFNHAPLPNPNRTLIKGSICGVKINEIEDPIIKEIRYLDKLIDELAKGKTIKKILREI